MPVALNRRAALPSSSVIFLRLTRDFPSIPACPFSPVTVTRRRPDAELLIGALSFGPLLNARGEVIGINAQKLIKKNVSGIGLALSATEPAS